ncbi:MAG: CPBP family intramembrane glutamic endopeptidase [Spirochaetia bacterium]
MTKTDKRARHFLLFAVLFYLLFAAAALLWAGIADSVHVLTFNADRPRPAGEVLILSAALFANILFDLYAPRILPSARRMFHAMGEALGEIGYPQAAVLAAASALGEEMLFRGAVQPTFGLPLASLLFALSHFPISRELLLWPIYALLMGLVLGTLRILGGDIWSAVLLHFLVNFFGLIRIGKITARGTADKNYLL